MGVSLLAPGGVNVRNWPGRWSVAPKKKGSRPKAAVSTRSTRSPRADRARPSVATILVLPTPPASEKTAIAGAREATGGGATSTGAGAPSNTPRSANQREVRRSRDPCSVSSAGGTEAGGKDGAGSGVSVLSHAGRLAGSRTSGAAQGLRNIGPSSRGRSSRGHSSRTWGYCG